MWQHRPKVYRRKVGAANVLASDVRNSKDLAKAGPFIYCDVTDKDGLSRIVLESGVTHIVHLATMLSAIGEKNPQLALRVNTVGIQNVLDVAASNQLKVRMRRCAAGTGTDTLLRMYLEFTPTISVWSGLLAGGPSQQVWG
jgi:nucleoside-diphosphate-sugar epimerase